MSNDKKSLEVYVVISQKILSSTIFDKKIDFGHKNVINFGPRGILRYSLDETDRMEQSGAWDFAAEFKLTYVESEFSTVAAADDDGGDAPTTIPSGKSPSA